MKSIKRVVSLLITLFLSTSLLMCGGGGSGSDDIDNPSSASLKVTSLTLKAGGNSIDLTPVFSSDVTSYSAKVGNDITSVEVSVVTDPADAQVTVTGNTGLSVGANNVQVLVTSGTASASYSISVTREASVGLSSLSLSSGGTAVSISPAFDKSVTSYSSTVAYAVDTVDIAYTAVPSGSTVSINGASADQISLVVGSNPVKVKVEKGEESVTYTVNVTREQNPDTGLEVTGISLNSGAVSLNEPFNAATYAYTASVENSVSSVTVDVTTNGTYTVTGDDSLSVGENTVTIEVTDGTDTVTYTVAITRAAPPLTVSALSLSAGGSAVTLSPAFDSDETTYSANVAYNVSSVIAAVTTNYPDDAAVSVTGNTLLQAGTNTVTVTVSYGTETKTYTITVMKEETLMVTAISIDAGGTAVSLSPSFTSTNASYTASVENTVETVTVSATVSPSGATLTGAGSVSLAEGANTVTLQGSYNTQSVAYTVVVHRAHDYSDEDDGSFNTDDISIKSLEMLRDAGGTDWNVPYSPGFARDQYVYTASVIAGTTSITLKAKKQGGSVRDEWCTISLNGNLLYGKDENENTGSVSTSYSENATIDGLQSGLNTIEVTVRKDDWDTIVAMRTYTIFLTVLDQTFDCTTCATTGYDYPACNSASAPSCRGNYAMKQQTFREYDYMMGMGYVNGQVNICDEFTDFLEGEMMGSGGVIPATGEIVNKGAISNGSFFTVRWYDYGECYYKAYDSLNGLLGTIGGMLPDYFDINNVMNFDFYGYSKMQVVGILNTADFPGIPTDDSSTGDVDEGVDGQFCIIHFKDMPTQDEAETIPYFTTNAQIAAVVAYYANFNPDDPTTTGTPPAGYENIRKIYFMTINE